MRPARQEWRHGLAPGERVYAVRFMGPRLYVVTFRQVDPLFVIDVSVPAAPVLLGELKIPGYSDYLHPLNATHLIGIGKDATEEGRVRGLVVMADEPLEAFPDIPALSDVTDLDLTLGAWRGLIAPADLPDEIATTLETAMDEIVHDEEWRDAMTERGFGIQWRPSAEFGDFMSSEQESVRNVIGTLGL